MSESTIESTAVGFTERVVYWLPWAELRSWLREECERFNTHPLVTSQRHFVELSYEWRDDDQGLLTYTSSRAGVYILCLVHSLERRRVSYGVLGHDEARGELNIVEHDGMGYFVLPDHKRLTIEEAVQRLIAVLIAASNKPRLVC